MAHKYGKTWWGQQWLNALEKIDYSNRLPRGRNYASKAQLLLSLLYNVLINGEKTLIFTQYKEMGYLLTRIIQEQTGLLPLFLHGGLSR